MLTQLKLSIQYYCETKVWLISVLMIIKQNLELMIIFQVWLDKICRPQFEGVKGS